MQGLPLLSLAIWAPIIAGVAVLFTGSDRNAQAARVIALVGAVIGFAVTIPLYTGFNLQQGGFQFVGNAAVDRCVQCQLSSRHRRHLAAADPAEQPDHRAGRHRRLGHHQIAGVAVHGGIPGAVGPDERRVLRARCAAVLCVLRGDADPDVHHHRCLGRPQSRLCGDEVLPLYAAGFAAVAGGADLPLQRCRRQFRVPRPLRDSAAACLFKFLFLLRFSWPLR